MNTFTAASKIFGMTLTKEMEVSDVCKHLDKQIVGYEVGAAGITFLHDRDGEPQLALNKVGGVWCFEMFQIL
jgi:hypothetical protein